MPARRSIRDDIAGHTTAGVRSHIEALREALAPLTADPSRAAVFCDIDGVLAPIVGRAEDALCAPGTAVLLGRLAPLRPRRLVSGHWRQTRCARPRGGAGSSRPARTGPSCSSPPLSLSLSPEEPGGGQAAYHPGLQGRSWEGLWREGLRPPSATTPTCAVCALPSRSKGPIKALTGAPRRTKAAALARGGSLPPRPKPPGWRVPGAARCASCGRQPSTRARPCATCRPPSANGDSSAATLNRPRRLDALGPAVEEGRARRRACVVRSDEDHPRCRAADVVSTGDEGLAPCWPSSAEPEVPRTCYKVSVLLFGGTATALASFGGRRLEGGQPQLVYVAPLVVRRHAGQVGLGWATAPRHTPWHHAAGRRPAAPTPLPELEPAGTVLSTGSGR